jgi:hypothetical protein
MLALIALTALSVILATVLKESPVAASRGRPPAG